MDAFTCAAGWQTLQAALNGAYAERVAYDPNGNIKSYQRNGTSTLAAMDDLTYQYPRDAAGNAINNRLRYIRDNVPDANYPNDLNSQTSLSTAQVLAEKSAETSTDYYQYDPIGNLTQEGDNATGNTVSWNVYGKIAQVVKHGTTGSTITYSYDASGNRISKTTNTTTTYYVRDASGDVMAVYEGTSTQMKVTETDLYGSNRLGLVSTQTVATAEQTLSGFGTVRTFTFTRGEKSYELSNHLGNVLSTISDRRQQMPVNSTVSYYIAEITSATDYYPFGMQMPGRTVSSSSYRYGFNGQEKSSELTEGQYTAEFWEYDARSGRRWNVDPKPNIAISPYATFENSPTWQADPYGDSIAPNRKEGMNFIVVPDKKLRRMDRIAHSGEQGKVWDYKDPNDVSSAYYKVDGLRRIWAGIKGTFRSAYTADFLKSKLMQISGFWQLNVVQAADSEDAVNKIKNKLGSNGYIENLTIDYHSEMFGKYILDDQTKGQLDGEAGWNRYNLSSLANGYIGTGSNVYLGQCWAGGNPNFCSNIDETRVKSDLTGMVSQWLDGATVYGNKAAASSLHFIFTNSFIGVVPEPYGTSRGNRWFIGQHSVSVYNPVTKTITQQTIKSHIRISNTGQISIE